MKDLDFELTLHSINKDLYSHDGGMGGLYISNRGGDPDFTRDIQDFTTNELCRLNQYERDWIFNKFKYDVWGDPEIRFFDYSILENSAEDEDINIACVVIQKVIGQTYGDNAGIFFSGYDIDETWPKMSYGKRLALLEDYLNHELLGEELKPFKFISANQRFPNGFNSWQETHYEIVQSLVTTESYSGSLADITREKDGMGGLYDLAEELTNEFEKKYKGVEWDGDFFDTVEQFMKDESVKRRKQRLTDEG